ncbi:MAG: hypothetical protein ACOC11_02985 [Prolixibacteraceae bacterium]
MIKKTQKDLAVNLVNLQKRKNMEALKFVPRVKKRGIIKIPELENYTNQKVNITVMLRSSEEENSPQTEFNDFLEKWAGFFLLRGNNDKKYNYLFTK